MAFSGTWLRDARKAKGLSQAALGEKVGAAQAQISQWETGKVAPTGDVRAKLEKLLGAAPGPVAAGKKATIEVVLPTDGKFTVDALERYLWSAADILRGSIDSSDYKGSSSACCS